MELGGAKPRQGAGMVRVADGRQFAEPRTGSAEQVGHDLGNALVSQISRRIRGPWRPNWTGQLQRYEYGRNGHLRLVRRAILDAGRFLAMDVNMKVQHGLSVVIPVYRSEDSLRELVRSLNDTLPKLATQFECILVNDGSPDNCCEIMLELAEKNDWLRAIELIRNFGQHNAVLCGIRHARYDKIVTMDDDLQHPPEEISRLIERLDQGFDVVYGYPEKAEHSLFRSLASWITKTALKGAMGADTANHSSAFRLFRTRVRRAFNGYRSPNVSIDVLLTWGTNKFSAVPVRHEPRRHGNSNYTFRTLTSHAFTMMTGFSTLPLRIANFLGFAFTLFGFGVFAYVVIRNLMGVETPSGFAFLAVIISLFSGVQLIALGIVGEYLARMHERMMDRPAYVVQDVRESTE